MDIENLIVKRIVESGNDAFFVGGFVRDEFLGIECNDIDIKTNMSPAQLQLLFNDLKATNHRD